MIRTASPCNDKPYSINRQSQRKDEARLTNTLGQSMFDSSLNLKMSASIPIFVDFDWVIYINAVSLSFYLKVGYVNNQTDCAISCSIRVKL